MIKVQATNNVMTIVVSMMTLLAKRMMSVVVIIVMQGHALHLPVLTWAKLANLPVIVVITIHVVIPLIILFAMAEVVVNVRLLAVAINKFNSIKTIYILNICRR